MRWLTRCASFALLLCLARTAHAQVPARADGVIAPRGAPSPAAIVTPPRPQAGQAVAEAPPKEPIAALHGYVQPQFGLRYRPQALPRDRWEYGGLSSRAGLIVSGSPVADFFYVVHLSLDVRSLLVISGVDLVDTNGDGSVDSLNQTRTATTRTAFEEVTVAYRPFDSLSFVMGAMRMPFTVASRSANTALMFPSRPGANEIFQSGSDQGILVLGRLAEERVSASLGVFTGTSLGLAPPNTEARGLVYSLRADASPLGKLPNAEMDFERAGFRFAVGAGGLLRNGTLYSRSGYELAESRDVRASASLRAAFYGAFVQVEALRRLLSDNVTSRPNQASGGYAQASFFFAVTDKIGLAPLGRVGLTVEDEATLPRKTLYIEGGAALFPRIDQARPESVRLLVQYQGERRITDDESAHGAIVQAQILF